ncbi:hypothetical protein BNATCHR287 (nucleomorph) [Bigelowiella natans]|uniref:KRR1 small subunit processome component first KH domain-containing protein n=1 Tax=Bigelowiella natans TaxID=227086 RepID=Q3LWA8_BIGNA|nr:hypothetical protein BNATCHR287 [Bigelowiella natans]ABA27258.1 hypothetical protein [Bigelowiella natans]
MFVVENKFTVLINTSKKHYFIKNWNRISKLFKSMQLNIIFEQSRRLIIISNQKNCIVPTILFKGLMFIRLVNRNVPYMQSKKIFNDSHIGTIIKINRKSNFLLNNFIIRLYKENRAKHMGKLTSLFSKTRLHYNTLWRNLVYCWTDYGCYLSG